MQATTTPSAASMPTVSVQLLRKCFAQLSTRTCRHGGGEHVVLAATAVCMCLQRRDSATFSTSSLLRMKKGAKSSLYRALPDITSNRRYIGSPPCPQISSSLYRIFRYSGPRYIGPPTVYDFFVDLRAACPNFFETTGVCSSSRWGLPRDTLKYIQQCAHACLDTGSA